MVVQKTKVQIIEEIIGFYLQDPKCNRKIITPISYCLKDRYKNNKDFSNYSSCDNYRSIIRLYNTTFDELLEIKYQGHCKEFWNELGALYSENHYWTPLKLNKRGNEILDNLIYKWKGL